MTGVVDTSAIVRLFIPDGPIPNGLEAFIRQAERGQSSVIAPELVMAEVANVFNRKRKEGVLSAEECGQLVTDCLALPIHLYSHRDILLFAVDIAAEHNLTVYDALFLALAQRHKACLFTMDTRLRKVADSLGI